MADEAPVVTAPAPVAAAPVTPATTSAQAPQAPVTEAPTAPVVAQAPNPAPVAETPPVAPPEAPKAPETLIAQSLDATKPTEPPKQPEVKPEGENKTAEGETKAQEGQTAEPAPPPTYDPFTVPEGVNLDAERVKEFTDILSELEVTGKADHEFVQKFGQKAVDFHVQEVTKAVETLQGLYQTQWEKTKAEWKDSFLKDPEIGGTRFQTTVDSARNFIRTHGGTPEQQQQFRDVMESSGLGNHPAIIRLLANAGLAMREGVPLAATTPLTPPKSKVATMYGNNK